MTAILHSKPWVGEAEQNAVVKQMTSGLIATGEVTEQFCSLLQRAVGTDYSPLPTVSGTAAIYLVVKALNLGSRDSVIVPSYVCDSVCEAISLAGTQVVLADIETPWKLSAENVRAVIDQTTKAILVPQLFGAIEDLSTFREFGCSLINDCAQSFDAAINNDGQDRGDFIILSFNATKCLTTGEGGSVIATNEMANAQLNKAYQKYKAVIGGVSDIASAIGIQQLERYEEAVVQRKSIATLYIKHLTPLGFKFPQTENRTGWFRVVAILPDSISYEALHKYAASHNVHIRKGVDALNHQRLGMEDSGFINSVEIFKQTVSLPAHASLTNDEILRVVQLIKHYVSSVKPK
ncbi:hypothetical protein AVL55_05055 [Alteromonas macleodii]|uniref:dTDP-4-amino-4,6-dideoxygalactose transaminase n=1 Tax=Alteromonas macleodii TaxID=28108 RepID=A0A126PX34_ALTMA|nr:DegT/DnrJ/EryC1/StrS family aminotransferase [Alteromonas macleodii]AMJ97584.1 hypothetical protein AVL55_05055 [Alteromonas macleodii]